MALVEQPGRIRRTELYRDLPVVVGTNYIWDTVHKVWVLPTLVKWPTSTPGTVFQKFKGCFDQLHPGPPYRTGGPLGIWSCENQYVQEAPISAGVYVSPNKRYKYEGGFMLSPNPFPLAAKSQMGFDPFTTYSSWDSVQDNWPGDAEVYGATGWNRFRPGNPTADAAVFLGELGDLPRMLKGTAKMFRDYWRTLGGHPVRFGPKRVANEWLNTQFGWMPFVNDMRKFYRTWRDLDKLLKHIVENNGRWVRRTGTVLNESKDLGVVAESDTVTGHFPILNSAFHSTSSVSGSYKVSLWYTDHAWFVGCFRYYIPDIGSVDWKRRAVTQLFGLRVNPELLWELTPWSWLIDWFSNVGDIVSNMDTGWAENLAAKYAYAMRTVSYRSQVESTLELAGTSNLTASRVYEVYRKSRSPASPFGFGLSSGDFSARQWSILGALGLSRLKFA